MAKELVSETRNDFRGGLNVYMSPDLLAPNELTATDNVRIDSDGPIIKRNGTRRLHASALAASNAYVTQWDGPSGSQLVAICNGDLFYRNQSGGEYAAFTQVDPGTTDAFSTTIPAQFTTLRGSASGAPLYLYIASGGKLYQWTGTTLTRIDKNSTGTLGQYGPDASLIATYHLRLFTNTLEKPQGIVWSKIGDGTNFKGGLTADGGAALISSIEADSIVAMDTLGRSLLLFTNDSIARVAGYSASDITIDQDTEGVSPEVGVVGPQALVRADRIVFFISEKGAYIASEGAIAPVGLKVQPIFAAMDRANLANIVVGHHHGRSEIWVAYAGPNDSDLNKSVLIFNLRHQAWYGPFALSIAGGITSLQSYTDPSNNNYIIAGCSDGFIRHLDIGTKDDVLSDGTSGSSFSWSAALSRFFFGNPEIVHAIKNVFVQAKVSAVDELYYIISMQTNPGATSVSVVSSGNPNTPDSTTVKSYRSAPEDRFIVGQRFQIILTGSGGAQIDAQPEVHGIVVYAYKLNRLV